jgi:hypothetical protein
MNEMEDYQIIQLGRILSYFVDCMGMQAENMQRASLGKSMKYTDEHFYELSKEITYICNSLR